MINWRFPSNDYGENKGLNDSGISTFKGTPIKSLAREICQNSLDAVYNVDKAVRVEFDLFKTANSRLPGRDNLVDAFFRCIDFWKSQRNSEINEFFSEAIDEIKLEESYVLRISDFNTSGLKGVNEDINTDWVNLTKSSGASDKRGTAGGSFGIGKFAPFACSYFSTVFYSTYNCEDCKGYQGVSRLVTFKREDGESTQGVGYYGHEKNKPINEEFKLQPEFNRCELEYGTDIYILGYKYHFNNNLWENDIIVSVLDSFLVAIWEEKLEVKVGNIVIDKANLGKVVESYKDVLLRGTYDYYQVLSSKETIWYDEKVFNFGKIRLGLLTDADGLINKIAMVRGTGMKIMDKDRIHTHVSFAGILFIKGEKLNQELRVSENPEHNKWEPQRTKFPGKVKEILKSFNDIIISKLTSLENKQQEESVDAAGVGMFIPDISIGDKISNEKENIISDKVSGIEITKVVRKKDKPDLKPTSFTEEPGEFSADDSGEEKVWFHNKNKHKEKHEKQKTPSDVDTGKDFVEDTEKEYVVKLDKVICFCVNKEKGTYVLTVRPSKSALHGRIELFLSAETQKYPAPIKNVKRFGGDASFSNNVISGLEFIENQEMKFKIELDYSDYCSIEVVSYASKK